MRLNQAVVAGSSNRCAKGLRCGPAGHKQTVGCSSSSRGRPIITLSGFTARPGCRGHEPFPNPPNPNPRPPGPGSQTIPWLPYPGLQWDLLRYEGWHIGR